MIDKKFIGAESEPRQAERRGGPAALLRQADRRDRSDLLGRGARPGRRASGAFPAPPTFPFSLKRSRRRPTRLGSPSMGVDLGRVLHGEQGFDYHAPIHAGDGLATPDRASPTSTTRRAARWSSSSGDSASPTRTASCARTRAASSSCATEEARIIDEKTHAASLDWNASGRRQTLPALTCRPITRTTLALFAGASGDHNPIHVDIDFARKSGMRRRVRARHAVDGLPRAAADQLGAARSRCAATRCASPASRR